MNLTFGQTLREKMAELTGYWPDVPYRLKQNISIGFIALHRRGENYERILLRNPEILHYFDKMG